MGGTWLHSCEGGTGERQRGELDRVGCPRERPILNSVRFSCNLFRERNEIQCMSHVEAGGRCIPICMKILIVIEQHIAADRLRGWVDRVSDVRIDLLAVCIEIFCGNMKRLMQVADKVSKQEQRLFFGGNFKRGGEGRSNKTAIAALMAPTISWSLFPWKFLSKRSRRIEMSSK